VAVDIESEFAGELDAIAGDVEKMKAELTAAKDAEIASLQSQLAEAKTKADAAQALASKAHEDGLETGRREGAATAIASVKRRLGLF